MATKIQLRRDTAASWANANPILSQGEPAFEIDTGREKIGDGVTEWNSLAYKVAGGGIGEAPEDGNQYARKDAGWEQVSAPADNTKADKSNVLELDNTDAFTPDADYEPATKKYVDDNEPDISGKADKTNVLELDNTDAFTPDADYEPATKKYVDDNEPDISGKADKTNVLELDNTDAFTPDADYEPATKKYVDDNEPDISGKADKTNVLELDNTDAFTPDADYEPATKKYVDDNEPDISGKEDLADIITVAESTGVYVLNQASKRQRLYKTTTSISANKSVDVKNGLEGSVFSWYLQVTGTIILNFTSSTQTCFSDSVKWLTKQLTIEGTTNSKIEIAGLYINGAWNIKVSGEMV
jgi:hypothetical protein